MKHRKKLAAVLSAAMMISALPQLALATEVDGVDLEAPTEETEYDEDYSQESDILEDESAEPVEEGDAAEDATSELVDEVEEVEEEIFDDYAVSDEEVIEESEVIDEESDDYVEIEEDSIVFEAADAYGTVEINETTFPDPIFRQYVIDELNGGSTILDIDPANTADRITSIDVSNMGISDLTVVGILYIFMILIVQAII